MKNSVVDMSFAKVYPLYVQKAERKGRTKIEVNAVIFWMTGYNEKTMQEQIDKDNNFQTFFEQAPQINPDMLNIKGSICGCRIEEITDELVRKIRCLDKLVDELAKGRHWTRYERGTKNEFNRVVYTCSGTFDGRVRRGHMRRTYHAQSDG